MIVTLGTGHVVPLHWNDRYYVGDCPKCDQEIWERTAKEWHTSLIAHWQEVNHQ
jgi:hypothetical protein